MNLIDTARAELVRIAEMENRLAKWRAAIEQMLAAAGELNPATLVLADDQMGTSATGEKAFPMPPPPKPSNSNSEYMLTALRAARRARESLEAVSSRDHNARITNKVEALLKERSPLKTFEILAVLDSLGLRPNSNSDPVGALSTILGRDDRFVADRAQGWSLKT